MNSTTSSQPGDHTSVASPALPGDIQIPPRRAGDGESSRLVATRSPAHRIWSALREVQDLLRRRSVRVPGVQDRRTSFADCRCSAVQPSRN